MLEVVDQVLLVVVVDERIVVRSVVNVINLVDGYRMTALIIC